MKKLRIDRIDIYKSDIPLKEPFVIAIMKVIDSQSLFIRITADSGLSGIGEGNPYWAITGETQAINLAGAESLARMLIGRDPYDIEGCVGELERFLPHNTTLRSAFDMALYDLLAKEAGLPLYAFLGGGKRVFWTDNTVGIGEPEVMAAKALGFKKEGFQAVKVKLGTTAEEDIARIRKVREAIGPELPIRTDANQGWDYNTAVRVLQGIEPYGVEYCEQPIAAWDYGHLSRLREKTSIAIMADESLFDHHDAYKLAVGNCCDYFNIKLAKSGGIHPALKINAIGEAAGIPCMLGCMTETRLALTAGAHVVSARPNIRFADLDGYLFLKEDPITGGAKYRVGEIHIPDIPGHGADVDPSFLKNCECVTIS
jgi:L-alanine-DL-glutamate epimerase-like enolase superfamily enzyme